MIPRRRSAFHAWLFAVTPVSTERVHLAEPLLPGTVIACDGDEHVQHDPDGPAPARGVVLRMLSALEALAVVRDATLIGPLLNGGRGISASTRNDLLAVGLGVLS